MSWLKLKYLVEMPRQYSVLTLKLLNGTTIDRSVCKMQWELVPCIQPPSLQSPPSIREEHKSSLDSSKYSKMMLPAAQNTKTSKMVGCTCSYCLVLFLSFAGFDFDLRWPQSHSRLALGFLNLTTTDWILHPVTLPHLMKKSTVKSFWS